MAGKGFKFIHTSDWHLDSPLRGVTEVPEHLVDDFLDAPLRAAMAVIDTAISEQVDFVILAGHLFDGDSRDVRASDFVWRQLHRLRDHGIGVAWVGTPSDGLGDWPLAMMLPPQVKLITRPVPEVVPMHRGDQLLCHLVASAAGNGPLAATTAFATHSPCPTLVAAHGEFTGAVNLALADVAYWALGGRHAQEEIEGLRGRAWYCGAPQGFTPQESQPHGCLLVEVDAARQARARFIPTDVLRWQTIHCEMPDDLDQAGLVRILREQAERAHESAPGRQVLLRWILVDQDASRDTRSDLLASRLRRGDMALEILRILRAELRQANRPVWPLAITTEPPETLPQGWYDEDTILGDLLRTVQQYQADPRLTIDLSLPQTSRQGWDKLLPALSADNRSDREHLLRQVAVLGVDLLRGDRVLTAEVET